MAGILTFPLSCFVGLAIGVNEVAVAGYVRQPTVLTACVDGVTYANPVSLQWQHAMQRWGTIDTAQLWDAAAGGTLLGSVSTFTPLAINQYDIARIPASGLAVTYDTINRPFGTGTFGTFAYGTQRLFNASAVLLERAFDQQHVCAPGIWSPGPFALAA
jgi:hypothetical protein